MIVKHKYFVGYQYVDAHYRIKNAALLGMFEDLAGMHGTIAGEDIRTADTVWILTAYRVKILKRPEYGEYVTLSTWSRSVRGLLAFREFEVRNRDGELLVCAVSEWAHIYKATGMPARVSQELADSYESEPDRTNFPNMRLRLTGEPAEYSFESEWQIGRNWIDVNRHMNNVHYAELAEMAMPDDRAEGFCASRFDIFYRKEIKCGQTVRCFYAEDENTHTVSIKSADGVTLHAQVKLYK